MPWIQYSLIDGAQTGMNSQRVSEADLAFMNKGQIFYNGDPDCMMVDITQNPPVVIPVSNG